MLYVGDDKYRVYVGSERRLMMAGGGGEPLPISDGLISWLDGKDITANATEWKASTALSSIYTGFKVGFTSGNTLVAGTCMRAGTNGGASMQVGSTKICENPFYQANVSADGDATIEVVFKFGTPLTGREICGGTYEGQAATYGPWRYQIIMSTNNKYAVNANNGRSWAYYIESNQTIDSSHHILTYQKEGTTLRFYIDGILDKEELNSALNLPVKDNSNYVGIGRYDGINVSISSNFIGDYYSYAIYNRALSAAEVLQNKKAYFKRYNLT